MRHSLAWAVVMAAAVAAAGTAAPAAPAKPAAPPAPLLDVPPAYLPEQARMLAIRAAQVDGLRRLTEMVLEARVSPVRTVGLALGAGSDAEIALRVFLRSAPMVGEPRVYSDGVAEVDVETPLDAIARKVADLATLGPGETAALDDLRPRTIDGCLRVSGLGRTPRDLAPGAVKRIESARVEDLPEMFPAGWQDVTGAGRVEALGAARVRAYRAMGELLRGILLGQTEKVGDLVGGAAATEATFDVFIRSLPVDGSPRLMPDRIAEVEVSAPVRDLLKVLKEIRAMRGPEVRRTDEEIDRLSVRLKADRLTVVGRGMPPAREVRPASSRSAPLASPLPDWAARVLEARGASRFSDETEDREEARLLAARSAKAVAMADLDRQVDAVKLDDGRTVRQRAAKDGVFRRDLQTLLSGARTAAYGPSPSGKGWEVALRLPLVRLYEFSRPRE